MIYVQLIILWLLVPTALFVSAVLRIRRLRRQREHDLILYAFCDARDTMAIKAAQGELDEKSETFRYFYNKLGQIVHAHKNYPLGFAHIAKLLAENKDQTAPTWVRRLMRELKKSDPEIKQVVGRYVWAINLVKKQDPIVGLVEKLAHGRQMNPVNLLATVVRQLLSKRTRQFSRFNSMLANVVDYSPAAYAAA